MCPDLAPRTSPSRVTDLRNRALIQADISFRTVEAAELHLARDGVAAGVAMLKATPEGVSVSDSTVACMFCRVPCARQWCGRDRDAHVILPAGRRTANFLDPTDTLQRFIAAPNFSGVTGCPAGLSGADQVFAAEAYTELHPQRRRGVGHGKEARVRRRLARLDKDPVGRDVARRWLPTQTRRNTAIRWVHCINPAHAQRAAFAGVSSNHPRCRGGFLGIVAVGGGDQQAAGHGVQSVPCL